MHVEGACTSTTGWYIQVLLMESGVVSSVSESVLSVCMGAPHKPLIVQGLEWKFGKQRAAG